MVEASESGQTVRMGQSWPEAAEQGAKGDRKSSTQDKGRVVSQSKQFSHFTAYQNHQEVLLKQDCWVPPQLPLTDWV